MFYIPLLYLYSQIERLSKIDGKSIRDYFFSKNEDTNKSQSIFDDIADTSDPLFDFIKFSGVKIPNIYTKEQLKSFISPFSIDINLDNYKDIFILTEPSRRHWHIYNAKTSQYLNGFKLGCKLYNVDPSNYIFPIIK